MPSRFSDLFASHAAPVLTEHLAEVDESTGEGLIVQYPLGDFAGGRLIAGIWCEESASDDQQRGHDNKRQVFLTIFDTTIPVDTRDQFALVASFNVSTPAEALALDPPANAVWKTRAIAYGTEPGNVLELERRDAEIRTGKGGHIL